MKTSLYIVYHLVPKCHSTWDRLWPNSTSLSQSFLTVLTFTHFRLISHHKAIYNMSQACLSSQPPGEAFKTLIWGPITKLFQPCIVFGIFFGLLGSDVWGAPLLEVACDFIWVAMLAQDQSQPSAIRLQRLHKRPSPMYFHNFCNRYNP